MKYKVKVPKSKPFKGEDGETDHYVEAPSKDSALSLVLVRLLKNGKLKYTERGGQTRDYDKNKVGLLYHIIKQHGDFDVSPVNTPDKKEDKEDWKARGVRDMKSKPKKDEQTQMSLFASEYVSCLDGIAVALEERGMRKHAEKVDEITNTIEKILPVLVIKGQNPELKNFIEAMIKDVEYEYAAAIQYIQHASIINGAEYETVRQELLDHARQEIEHAIKISDKINWLGGAPSVGIEERLVSTDVLEMLKQDLYGEQVAIDRYKKRIKQAENLEEFGVRTLYEEILLEEEEHENDLMTALKLKNRGAIIKKG